MPFYPYDLVPCQVRPKRNELSEVEKLQSVTWELNQMWSLTEKHCLKFFSGSVARLAQIFDVEYPGLLYSVLHVQLEL